MTGRKKPYADVCIRVVQLHACTMRRSPYDVVKPTTADTSANQKMRSNYKGFLSENSLRIGHNEPSYTNKPVVLVHCGLFKCGASV